MPQATGPVPIRDIVVIVGRGVALLGIFIMNMPGFSQLVVPPRASGSPLRPARSLDPAADHARDLLFAGKFNSMFSLLFGIGFTLQLTPWKSATEPEQATGVYVRPLVCCGRRAWSMPPLLWSGDVSPRYAVLGFALLLRRACQRTRAGRIDRRLVFPGVFEAWRPHLVTAQAEALAAFDYQDLEASNNQAYGTGSFVDAAGETWRMLAWGYGTTMGRWSYALFYAHMATGMLMATWSGGAAGRHGGSTR